MFVLDKFDKILLQELDKDSSIPLHALATKLKRSKQFVSYRLQGLEKEGVILGYHSIIDVLSLGYFPFRVLLDFVHMTEKEKGHFIEKMKVYPQVVHIDFIHEQWDCALYILTKDVEEFRTVWDSILLSYRPHLKREKISLFAPVYIFNKSFVKEAERKVAVFGRRKKTSKYEELLFHYASHVREPLLALAKKTKMSPITAKKVLLDLKKTEIILRNRLFLNPEALGKQYYLLMLSFTHIRTIDSFISHCTQVPQIYQVNRVLGGEDIELFLMVENRKELLQIIDQLKEKYKEEIRDDDFFSFSPGYSKGILPT